MTTRELEIVKLLAAYSNKEIARRLNISPSTMKNHMTAILRKCRARGRGRLGALMNALRTGALQLDDLAEPLPRRQEDGDWL